MASNPEQLRFLVEAWTEYAVGLVVLFIRIVYRYSVVGLDWQGDDWMAAVAVILWTLELVAVQLIGQFGSTTGMTDEIALTLSDSQKANIVVGSKILLAGWVVYISMIWCLKACMLFFYNRLTFNTQQQRLVKITTAICIVSYIATVIVCLSKCGPIERHWQVYPYPGDQCALNIPNYYALVTTNVFTDLMILYIPIPLLWTVQLPLRKKVLYGLWLCTGVFIIVATILRCVLALADKTQISQGTLWSVRETVVAIIAVNIPVLSPLIKSTTKFIGKFTSRKGTSHKQSSEGVYYGGDTSGTGKSPGGHQLSVLEAQAKQKRIRRGMGWTTIRNESEEDMIEEAGSNHLHPKDTKNTDLTISSSNTRGDDAVLQGKIQVKSTFEIKTSY